MVYAEVGSFKNGRLVTHICKIGKQSVYEADGFSVEIRESSRFK